MTSTAAATKSINAAVGNLHDCRLEEDALKPKISWRSIQRALSAVGTIFLAAGINLAQGNLPVQWEDLTGPDFVTAIHKAQNTCLLPIGILEKHGPHLPIGTDLFNARYVAIHAAERDYSVVFPAYYFGQIFEARHQPGTVAYSAHMQLDLLQETTDEMARNGCKKILIVNAHGGNNHLLPYFAQIQLASPHDYVVYVLPLPKRVPVKDKVDAHAGESETSVTMVTHPDRCIWTGREMSRAPTLIACTFPKAYTLGFGGMRGSPITMPAKAFSPRKPWEKKT